MKYYDIYLHAEPDVKRSYRDPDGMVSWKKIAPGVWHCLVTEEQLQNRRDKNRVVRSHKLEAMARKGDGTPMHVYGPDGFLRDPDDDEIVTSRGEVISAENQNKNSSFAPGRDK